MSVVNICPVMPLTTLRLGHKQNKFCFRIRLAVYFTREQVISPSGIRTIQAHVAYGIC